MHHVCFTGDGRGNRCNSKTIENKLLVRFEAITVLSAAWAGRGASHVGWHAMEVARNHLTVAVGDLSDVEAVDGACERLEGV